MNILNAVKDSIERKIYLNPNIVAYVDQTPIVLETIAGVTIKKRGQKAIKIDTFGKTKERISCILCIFLNGMKSSINACI